MALDLDSLQHAATLAQTVLFPVAAALWNKASKAEAKAEAACAALAEHKLHVAESYLTKTDLEKQLAPINKALDRIEWRLDRLAGDTAP